jgi:capsule polysaccharide export protein KpsE/RkpR
MIETSYKTAIPTHEPTPNWVSNANRLWEHRRLLARVCAIALVVSTSIAFLMPKQYESIARLMPPESGGSSAAMLAALSGRGSGGLGGLSSLAGSLLGVRSSGVLFVELLRSRSIADHLIDRFDLQRVYKTRYRIDTVKSLARRTTVVEDKKSGVLMLTVTDTDAQRARDIAQAYLEELNSIVTRANTSSARREREFIEKRLVSVEAELQDAQNALSQFSSHNTTLDIKEQTRAMVDATAKLEGEKIVGESELASLQQIYGDDNVRVRAARARIGGLQKELDKMSGSDGDGAVSGDSVNAYPTLRQIPKLAVPYANLYRRVRIQETVFELLSQQYEMARIEEAKDTPVVSVIDSPLVAEKKSFPPRLLVLLILTASVMIVTSAFILLRESWYRVGESDPRKVLVLQVVRSIRTKLPTNEVPL